MPVEPVPLNTSVSAPQPTIDMLAESEPDTEAPSLQLDDHGLDFAPPEPTPAAAAPVPAAPAPAAAAPADDGMLEFDLGGLSLDLPGSSPAPATPAASAPAPAAPPAHEVELAPLAFDLDTPPASAPAAAATAGDDSDDPLATKLALAEEFNAIGDADGARSLAEEVLAEASGDLKSRAQRLLAEIG
jgi:pilus assembly protein FimV